MSENNTPFLKGFSCLRIPILDENEKSVWPERFTDDKIQEIQNRVGKHRFQTQMMLQRPDEKQAFFDLNLLQFYADELIYREANQTATIRLNNQKLISGVAFWDPSLGKQRGDQSVLACLFKDEKNIYAIHRLIYLEVEQSSQAAQEQCDQVIEILKNLYIKTLVIETNGIGGFLPEIFRARCRAMRYPVSIRPLHQKKAKKERIISTLDPMLSSGFLKFHESIRQTPFMQELKQWHPDANHLHDDGLDAVCGALSADPMRLGFGK